MTAYLGGLGRMAYNSPPDSPPSPALRGLRRRFGDLSIRLKLVILHNLFFAVLSAAVFWALAPVGGPARWTLLAVLAAVYGLAVLMLEFVLMPLYIYRPLAAILEADRALRRGDRDRELIPPELITSDELGRIMRSRNDTMAELRRHEDSLAEALVELEATAEDLRRKNNMLETARRSIAEQDRLASLGLLSAGVAHELNTPLAVLRGSIEQMLETERDAQSRARLERMSRVTERLRHVGENLLEFSRVRQNEVGRVAVDALVRESWELVAIDPKALMVRIDFLIAPEHAVRGNSNRLGQVFVNLLRNALDAVQPGGRIVASSRRGGTAAEPTVIIAIEDDGPGIPDDVLPNLFEAFVSTRLDAHGTGLGLTVAAGIVERHRGRIAASNRAGGGARLEVVLPATIEEVTTE
jgi:signal transduction histidine kinase